MDFNTQQLSLDQIMTDVTNLLNSSVSSYRIGKVTGLNQQSITRYRNGKYNLINIRLKTLLKLHQAADTLLKGMN